MATEASETAWVFLVNEAFSRVAAAIIVVNRGIV
jgi:hypothetical protein